MDKLDLLKLVFESCGAKCKVIEDSMAVELKLPKSQICFNAIVNDTFNVCDIDALKKRF